MLKLNSYDKKAISSITIGQAAMVNVVIFLKEASTKEDRSEYYRKKIGRILEDCEAFECWLNKVNDRFANNMKKNHRVTMVNRAGEHITMADKLMGDKLKIPTAEEGDVYVKKAVSAITIIQSALINADKIFSSSLKHSKKDMITKDIIMDVIDKIDEYVELTESIVEFLATSMSKIEYDVVMERASIYLKLVDEENGLL